MSDHYHMTSGIEDSDREAWNIPIKTHISEVLYHRFTVFRVNIFICTLSFHFT